MRTPELHQPVAARFQSPAKRFYRRGIEVTLLDADFDALDGTELNFVRTANKNTNND